VSTSTTRTWTIVTWNLRGAARPDLATVAGHLRDRQADVVVLQEVRRGQAARIAEQLSMRHAWALKHHPFTRWLPQLAEGLAILTPHALDATGSASLTPGVRRSSHRHRIVQWGLVQRPDHSGYRVYHVHLSARAASAARLDEAARVRALVEQHGGAPAIIAGDLNDHDEPAVVARLGGIDAIGDPPEPTNPASAPTQRLDHVLVPADGRVDAVDVPGGGPAWAALSDHLPVTVRFSQTWVVGDLVPQP
jgi:endonuclease/exonuclease/phosphatase family metal-dependent hydrolase